MSNATTAAEAAESTTTDAPAQACAAACPCAAEGGNDLGGLPFEIEITMRVAGMPPVAIGEGAGQLGRVVTSIDPDTGRHVVDVAGISYGTLYRAAAEVIETALITMRAEAELCDVEDAAAAEAEAAAGEPEGGGQAGAEVGSSSDDGIGTQPHDE